MNKVFNFIIQTIGLNSEESPECLAARVHVPCP